ncbi:MAG: inorganic diphosphatase [Vulcanimicrobiaceae bacterium]
MKNIHATQYENIPTLPKGGKYRAAVVHGIVETPKGSTYKYALEPALGTIALKSVLASGMLWPYDYGFIPQTLGADGDPLDLLVLLDEPTFSGCLVRTRILGSIRVKQDDIENDRFVGAPEPMPGRALFTDGYRSLGDIPRETLEKIERFLHDYSVADGHRVDVLGRIAADEALTNVRAGAKKFAKKR